MQLIDLSHTIEAGMPLFSDRAPQPSIGAWMSHAQAAESGLYDGCTCEITQVSLVTSAGTYMDSPYHFNPAGAAIEALTLEQLVLPGVVVDCTDAQPGAALDAARLDGVEVTGRAVLLHTGWSRWWGQPAYRTFPFVSRGLADRLVAEGARLVGVDTLVVDDLADKTRPAHVTLLHNNVLIVENLTDLGKLPVTGFWMHAAPVKVAGAAAFPVRAYAVVG